MNMPFQPRFALTVLTLAIMAGCASTPPTSAALEQARSDYSSAEATPATRDLASAELRQASEALNKASDAWNRRDSPAEVDHLAYLAEQRIAIANAAGKRKAAEQTVAAAGAERDRVVLAARTREADGARLSAEAAQRDAEAAQRQSAAAQQQSVAAQQQAAQSQRQSADAQRQSSLSQQQARDAEMRNAQLEIQLKELNAKKTERGFVITISDVLFATDRAQLEAGGMRDVGKLAAFLKQFPQRRALVEGFTDSTGGDAHNQELSMRRAEAVRAALVDQGVGGDRVSTRGYGELYPVASNGNAGGRQLNRRVEIILSDENGTVTPR